MFIYIKNMFQKGEMIMFDEIEKIRKTQKKEEKKTVKENVNKESSVSDLKEGNLFEVENITNHEIGQKIKLFSKIFLRIEVCFLAFLSLVMFMSICLSARELGAGIFLILLFATFLIIISFGLAYYIFLIVSGFGALVEDVNNIKENFQGKEKESLKKVPVRAKNVKSKSKNLQEISQEK